MSHDTHEHVEPPKPHVLPLSVYWGVFGALIFLTVVTVATAQLDLGPFNVPLALLIASTKGLLVALVFMHLWWDHKQNALIFAVSLLFLVIFIVLTMADTEARGLVDLQKQNYLPRQEMLQEYYEKNPDAVAPRYHTVPGTETKAFELKAPDPAKLHNADAAH